MKNYLNYSIILLVTLCFGLTSCSKDDDDDNGGGSESSAELTVDGSKVSVYRWCNSYITSVKCLTIEAYTTKEISLSAVGFHADWWGLDINSLKSGDDLCKKASRYELSYWTDTKACYSRDAISVIVKDLNLSKQQITIEFKDVEVKGTGLFGKPDEIHTISGTLTATYEIIPG